MSEYTSEVPTEPGWYWVTTPNWDVPTCMKCPLAGSAEWLAGVRYGSRIPSNAELQTVAEALEGALKIEFIDRDIEMHHRASQNESGHIPKIHELEKQKSLIKRSINAALALVKRQ